jgi:hypothetical protein
VIPDTRPFRAEVPHQAVDMWRHQVAVVMAVIARERELLRQAAVIAQAAGRLRRAAAEHQPLLPAIPAAETAGLPFRDSRLTPKNAGRMPSFPAKPEGFAITSIVEPIVLLGGTGNCPVGTKYW